MKVAQRYAQLQAQIARVAAQSGRDPAEIAVLAVTKAQPAQAIEEALAAGIRDVGENYVQEAKKKFAARDDIVRKHFIGHIQTNKARAIAELFDVVQSVDRIEAADALARAAETLGKVLPVLIQVNISPAQRHGCDPDRAAELAERVRATDALRLDGVMAIGPLGGERTAIVRAFRRAGEIFRAVGGTTLSLGMSDDWEEAVAAGSTMIRIGTALFGPRTRGGLSKEERP